MIGTFSNTAWVLLVLSVVILAGARVPAHRRDDTRCSPGSRRCGRGSCASPCSIVLATALNDSGVQVTGMMAAMTLPTLVFLATRFVDTDDTDRDAHEPDPGTHAGASASSPPS